MTGRGPRSPGRTRAPARARRLASGPHTATWRVADVDQAFEGWRGACIAVGAGAGAEFVIRARRRPAAAGPTAWRGARRDGPSRRARPGSAAGRRARLEALRARAGRRRAAATASSFAVAAARARRGVATVASSCFRSRGGAPRRPAARVEGDAPRRANGGDGAASSGSRSRVGGAGGASRWAAGERLETARLVALDGAGVLIELSRAVAFFGRGRLRRRRRARARSAARGTRSEPTPASERRSDDASFDASLENERGVLAQRVRRVRALPTTAAQQIAVLATPEKRRSCSRCRLRVAAALARHRRPPRRARAQTIAVASPSAAPRGRPYGPPRAYHACGTFVASKRSRRSVAKP